MSQLPRTKDSLLTAATTRDPHSSQICEFCYINNKPKELYHKIHILP